MTTRPALSVVLRTPPAYATLPRPSVGQVLYFNKTEAARPGPVPERRSAALAIVEIQDLTQGDRRDKREAQQEGPLAIFAMRDSISWGETSSTCAICQA